MKFEIRGARRDSGTDVVTSIEARSDAEAEIIARAEGILISSVVPISAPSTQVAMLVQPPRINAQSVHVAMPPPPMYVPPAPVWQSGPICQACGGRMKKKIISSGNCVGILLALIVLFSGLAVTILIPVVGWVIGPLMILLALFMGGKRQKIWRCANCRAFVPRA